jgi:signal transduction histidine kinase
MSVSRGLGRALALSIALGMLVFAAILGYSIYTFEMGEACEEQPAELVEQSLLAFTFAAPIGVAIALLISRRLTHTTTDRLDEVIASAARMTGENLAERLPVSRTNDALDRLSAAFNDLLERVESGAAAQRQFAADASHELRTPLTVISTNLEVARRKSRDVAHWENVADQTLAEVRHMNELVDKLLELSRAGAVGLILKPGDLDTLAHNAIARSMPLAREHHVEVSLDSRGAAHASIDADAIRIVMDNLIRNAIAHSPRSQSVTVRVGPGPRFTVEDRGPGVPAASRERIFEPFARGQHATDRATGVGLGLGLAICKRIVDGHRGTITVDDRDGGGARFTVSLPG